MNLEEVKEALLDEKEVQIFCKFRDNTWIDLHPYCGLQDIAAITDYNLRGLLSAKFRLKPKKVIKYFVVYKHNNNNYFISTKKYKDLVEFNTENCNIVGVSIIKDSSEGMEE